MSRVSDSISCFVSRLVCPSVGPSIRWSVGKIGLRADVQHDLNYLKTGFGGILGCLVFWWGPLGSRVEDSPPKVEDGMGLGRKIVFCAKFENVQLDLNRLNIRLMKRVAFLGVT